MVERVTILALLSCVPAVLVAFGCLPPRPQCASGMVESPVLYSRDPDAFVCVAAPVTASPPTPSPSVATNGCVVLEASGPTLPIVAKSAPPPPPPPTAGTPPDGGYVLVEASRSADTDAGADAPTVVKGALSVSGARLVLGIETTAAESFVLTYASGGLTKVCAVAPGTFAASFLPGPDETSYSAVLAWDSPAATLTMRFGELELVWVRVS
jgi:hypothetical protein